MTEPNDAMRRARERYLAQQQPDYRPPPPAVSGNTIDAGGLRLNMGPARPAPIPRPRLEVMTVAEIAAELHVSKMTVYRLIHDGTLPCIRVGRTMRVKVSDYIKFAGLAS